MLSSNGLEVAWLVLPAAWRVNLCRKVIATKPRELLSGAFNYAQRGCLKIGAINLIPEGAGVVPPPLVYLVAGFVTQLPHI